MQKKIDVIQDAYSQMRISGLTVNPTPNDVQLALIRLENIMAGYEARNIDVGYNFEDTPNANSLTNADRYAFNFMASNLAVKLLQDFGKPVDQALMMNAQQSLSTVSGRSALKFTRENEYTRRNARGSGNTLRYNRWARFYRTPVDAPQSATTSFLNAGDVNDYIEHFDQYLNDSETITALDIDSDVDLTLSNTSFTDTDVNYRVTVSDNLSTENTGFQRVIMSITTSDGRKTSRQVNFQINTN